MVEPLLSIALTVQTTSSIGLVKEASMTNVSPVAGKDVPLDSVHA